MAKYTKMSKVRFVLAPQRLRMGGKLSKTSNSPPLGKIGNDGKAILTANNTAITSNVALMQNTSIYMT